MNVLLASVYYGEIQQSYPIFVEHIRELDPKPKKTILYDLLEQRKLDQKPVEGIIEIRAVEREKNLMTQISVIRNEVLKEAKSGSFEAVLFVQPSIFIPKDIIKRLFDSEKEVIAPGIFTFSRAGVVSNAIKKNGLNNDGSDKLELVLFNDLLPSGVKPVYGASLECIFLKKSVFDSLEFKQVNTALEEMIAFKEQTEKQGKQIFLDSSTVCSKLGPMQLMSYYYFKAQKLAEKNK